MSTRVTAAERSELLDFLRSIFGRQRGAARVLTPRVRPGQGCEVGILPNVLIQDELISLRVDR